MPTLHGFSYSNYYNMPKHALLYKGVTFEEDLKYPSAEGYSKFSPALKVPSLTTDDGQQLSEAAVLCEYIEDAYPDKPLFPADPVERNKVRQLMHMAELYIELPNRRLLPFSFSNQPAPEQLINEIKSVVEYISGQRLPEFRVDLKSIPASGEDQSGSQMGIDGIEGEDDEALLKKAMLAVAESQKASTSFLQRRLRIGYNRAALLIEELEDRMHIGPQNGSTPREVFLTPEEVEWCK